MYFIGNSAYGKVLQSLETHRDVKFCEVKDENVSKYIKNPRFHSLSELGGDVIELENFKDKQRLYVPIQIGFFTLEYAKLSILKFYYDFILKYLSSDSFCLIESDTDALYLALSEQSFYLSVKPDMRNEFVEEHEKWLCREYCDNHKVLFFENVFSGHTWDPKECCKTVAKFYQRQAGLFHCENVSKGVVALTSKCYYCFGKDVKFSSKGVRKKFNNSVKEIVLPDRDFVK